MNAEPGPLNPDAAGRSATSRSCGTSHVARGWHSRGYLPHCDSPGLRQGITFRLHDAVPQAVIAGWKQELQWIGNREDSDRERWDEQRRELSRRLAVYEDAGYGACHLGRPDIARMVEGALQHFDGLRYDLMTWCIMPNHVHVLIRTRVAWPVGHLVQSWKRHTARKANRLLGSSGAPFWAADYHDRFMRDEAHFWRSVHYIHENPVKAGLCSTAADWKWSSAAEWTAKLHFAPPDETGNEHIG